MQVTPHRQAGPLTRAPASLSLSSSSPQTQIFQASSSHCSSSLHIYIYDQHMDLPWQKICTYPSPSLLKIWPINLVFTVEPQHIFCSRHCPENPKSDHFSPPVSQGRFLKEWESTRLWHDYVWGSCKLSRRSSIAWSQNTISLVKTLYFRVFSPAVLDMN